MGWLSNFRKSRKAEKKTYDCCIAATLKNGEVFRINIALSGPSKKMVAEQLQGAEFELHSIKQMK